MPYGVGSACEGSWVRMGKVKNYCMSLLSGTAVIFIFHSEQPFHAASQAAAARTQAARELRYERVSFGDVASAPPALAPPRRAAPGDGAPRVSPRMLILYLLANKI